MIFEIFVCSDLSWIFFLIVSLIYEKNIGEDKDSFSVRNPRNIFSRFPLSFLLFNFHDPRTKKTKLMIFEIFLLIDRFSKSKCFASRIIFPQACDHPPTRPIPPFDYLPSRKIFCSSGVRLIKPLQNQTLRNLTFIPCSAINLGQSERLNNTGATILHYHAGITGIDGFLK